MTCAEKTLEDFLAAPLDEELPPVRRQSTPQAKHRQGSVPKLPFDNGPASEDRGRAENSSSPTPVFGNGSKQGFLVDPRSTGGAAPGPAAAKNAKAPLAQVGRWQTVGMRESRWSGA